MPGYLLDNNHVAALFQRHSGVIQKLRSLPPDTQLRACVVTLGEIKAGHQMTTTTNQPRMDDYTAFVNGEFRPNALPISASTDQYYADIIGRIWQQHPPANPKIKTEAHLVSLGVDINDVWAVACAWEHGLIFVTTDKMTRIKQLVPEVQFDCWIP